MLGLVEVAEQVFLRFRARIVFLYRGFAGLFLALGRSLGLLGFG